MGTSDYDESTGLDNLPGVHNNLVALEHALTNSATGVFAQDHCVVINNPDTAKSLVSRLRRAAGQAQDVLLIYYAGHGILAGPDADLYMTVRETNEYLAENTAVAFDTLSNIIKESPARTRILILDCCFSGRAIGAMSSTTAALSKVNVSGTFVLTSTEANREARALPGERYTAFTAALLDILNKGLPGSEADVRLNDLYRPLQAAMAARGLPSPKKSAGDTSGDIVLRKASAPIVVQPAPPPAPVAQLPPTTPVEPARPVVTPPGNVSAATASPGPGDDRSPGSTRLSPPADRTAIRPLASRDTLRGIGKGTWTGSLWALTVTSGVFFVAAIGAAVAGSYEGVAAAVSGIVIFTVLFGLCCFLLARRYVRRRRDSAADTEKMAAPRSPRLNINQTRQEFFADVFSRLRTVYPVIRSPRIPASNWCQFAAGPFGYYALTFSRQGYRIEIYLDTTEQQSTKKLFDQLYERRDELQNQLRLDLNWERLDSNRASRIAIYLPAFDLVASDETQRRQAVEWTVDAVSTLHTQLDPELRRLASELK